MTGKIFPLLYYGLRKRRRSTHLKKSWHKSVPNSVIIRDLRPKNESVSWSPTTSVHLNAKPLLIGGLYNTRLPATWRATSLKSSTSPKSEALKVKQFDLFKLSIWKCWRKPRFTQLGEWVYFTCAPSPFWVWTTPLGLPVLPLEYIIKALSSPKMENKEITTFNTHKRRWLYDLDDDSSWFYKNSQSQRKKAASICLPCTHIYAPFNLHMISNIWQ